LLLPSREWREVASAVSRLNQTLTEQYEAWRERSLLTHYRIIYLDGIHFTVRHGAKTDATMILPALGVDLEGSREVLALRACAEEDKDGWLRFVCPSVIR
jgi:putative transposase